MQHGTRTDGTRVISRRTGLNPPRGGCARQRDSGRRGARSEPTLPPWEAAKPRSRATGWGPTSVRGFAEPTLPPGYGTPGASRRVRNRPSPASTASRDSGAGKSESEPTLYRQLVPRFVDRSGFENKDASVKRSARGTPRSFGPEVREGLTAAQRPRSPLNRASNRSTGRAPRPSAARREHEADDLNAGRAWGRREFRSAARTAKRGRLAGMVGLVRDAILSAFVAGCALACFKHFGDPNAVLDTIFVVVAFNAAMRLRRSRPASPN